MASTALTGKIAVIGGGARTWAGSSVGRCCPPTHRKAYHVENLCLVQRDHLNVPFQPGSL